MARTKARKNKAKKRKLGVESQNTQAPNQKQNKAIISRPKSKNSIQDEDPILFGSTTNPGSESDSPPASPTRIQSLLEPYTKPQLVAFLLDAALSDPDLRARIRSLADSDISHRKIFVYGIGWDATKENLIEAFSPFGPIEDCNLIYDKNTGRAKGYGFVLFKARSGAVRALREPQKRIGKRMASCQLATVGGVKPEGGRKIYVSNVHPDTRPEKLREFFAKFGEIESGPMGYDAITGKSRGYAIFVYKSQEEAKRVLEEPFKMFEGHQLHCKLATPGHAESLKSPMLPLQAQAVAPTAAMSQAQAQAQAQQQQQQQQQQSVLAAVAASQNLALLGQNPAYAALWAQNPLLAAAALSPGIANTNVLGGGLVNAGVLGGAGAPYVGGPPVLGSYSLGQGTAAVGFPGLQGYQVSSPYQAGAAQMLSGMAGGSSGFAYDVMKQNR